MHGRRACLRLEPRIGRHWILSCLRHLIRTPAGGRPDVSACSDAEVARFRALHNFAALSFSGCQLIRRIPSPRAAGKQRHAHMLTASSARRASSFSCSKCLSPSQDPPTRRLGHPLQPGPVRGYMCGPSQGRIRPQVAPPHLHEAGRSARGAHRSLPSCTQCQQPAGGVTHRNPPSECSIRRGPGEAGFGEGRAHALRRGGSPRGPPPRRGTQKRPSPRALLWWDEPQGGVTVKDGQVCHDCCTLRGRWRRGKVAEGTAHG